MVDAASPDPLLPLPVPDPAFRWQFEGWERFLRCMPLASIAQHLFTSRQPQLHGDDTGPPWDLALRLLAADSAQLRRVTQVHGNVVRVADAGSENRGGPDDRPAADAIVSNVAGLVLAVVVADCVPILVADGVTGAAAAIHAGWRGTCARIVAEAVTTMVVQFGSRPENLVAAIGPSIGPDDYEVGESLRGSFAEAGHTPAALARWFRPGPSQPHLDLWTANRDQLESAGLLPDRIFSSRLSTLAHADVFHSYRAAAAQAGRMAALIRVPLPAAR